MLFQNSLSLIAKRLLNCMASLQYLRVFIVGQLTKVSKNAVKHAEVWAIHTMLKLVYLETISISTRLGRVITQFSFNKQLSI